MMPLKVLKPKYLERVTPERLFNGTIPDPEPDEVMESPDPVDITHVVTMLNKSATAMGLDWNNPQSRRSTDAWVAPKAFHLYRPTPRMACAEGAWAYILLQEMRMAKANGQDSYLARRYGNNGVVTLDHFFGEVSKNALSRLWIMCHRTCVNGMFCPEAFTNSEITQDLIRNSYSKNPLLAFALSKFVGRQVEASRGTTEPFDTDCVKGLSMEMNLIRTAISDMAAYPHDYKADAYDSWAKDAPPPDKAIKYEEIDVKKEIGPKTIIVNPDLVQEMMNKFVLGHVSIETCHTYKKVNQRKFYWIIRRLLNSLKEKTEIEFRLGGVIETLAYRDHLDDVGTVKHRCLRFDQSPSELRRYLGRKPSESDGERLKELGKKFGRFMFDKSSLVTVEDKKLKGAFEDIRTGMADIYDLVKDDAEWNTSLKDVIDGLFKR